MLPNRKMWATFQTKQEVIFWSFCIRSRTFMRMSACVCTFEAEIQGGENHRCGKGAVQVGAFVLQRNFLFSLDRDGVATAEAPHSTQVQMVDAVAKSACSGFTRILAWLQGRGQSRVHHHKAIPVLGPHSSGTGQGRRSRVPSAKNFKSRHIHNT